MRDLAPDTDYEFHLRRESASSGGVEASCSCRTNARCSQPLPLSRTGLCFLINPSVFLKSPPGFSFFRSFSDLEFVRRNVLSAKASTTYVDLQWRAPEVQPHRVHCVARAVFPGGGQRADAGPVAAARRHVSLAPARSPRRFDRVFECSSCPRLQCESIRRRCPKAPAVFWCPPRSLWSWWSLWFRCLRCIGCDQPLRLRGPALRGGEAHGPQGAGQEHGPPSSSSRPAKKIPENPRNLGVQAGPLSSSERRSTHPAGGVLSAVGELHGAWPRRQAMQLGGGPLRRAGGPADRALGRPAPGGSRVTRRVFPSDARCRGPDTNYLLSGFCAVNSMGRTG